MSQLALQPPFWVQIAAPLVRSLPAGRYRAMNLVCRQSRARFAAEVPGLKGVRFACDLRNVLAREVLFAGSYEPQETALVRNLLRPGDTFVDVGAHWGYFSVLAGECVGARGKVISVEADPRIHALLSETAALNPHLPIETLHLAVADQPGKLRLSGFSEDQDNWGVSSLAGAGAEGFLVPSCALDDLLDEQGVGKVALVKIDIEGAEELALRGMKRGLASGRYRAILMELHPTLLPQFGTSPEAVLRRLTDAGYALSLVDHSPAAYRSAAYGKARVPRDVLRPWKAGEPLGEWPHVLAERT